MRDLLVVKDTFMYCINRININIKLSLFVNCYNILSNTILHYLIHVDVGDIRDIFPRLAQESHVLHKNDDVLQVLVPEAACAQGQNEVDKTCGMLCLACWEYHNDVVAEITLRDRLLVLQGTIAKIS